MYAQLEPGRRYPVTAEEAALRTNSQEILVLITGDTFILMATLHPLPVRPWSTRFMDRVLRTYVREGVLQDSRSGHILAEHVRVVLVRDRGPATSSSRLRGILRAIPH